MGELIVIAAIAGAVFLAIRSMWRDHKSGKSCCGGSCSGCSGCSCCGGEEKPV